MNISTDLQGDIWHDLQEPGSYEWWYFDAEDHEQELSFVCIWFAGFAFSPYYMEHYLNWRNNGSVPPKALDYAAFSFQLYEKGKEAVNFIREGSSLFEGSGNRIDIRFEQNRFHYDAQKNAYILDIAFDFPARRQKVTAHFVFGVRDRFSYKKNDENNNGQVPHHEWLLALPQADVSGSITIDDTLKNKSRTIRVRARGYHDHNLGLIPVHEYIDTWYWGRAFSGKYALVYYVIYFRNREYKPLSICLLHDTVTGELHPQEEFTIKATGSCRGLFAPVHGRSLTFSGEGFRLAIDKKQVLDSGPFYLRYTSNIVLKTRNIKEESLQGISEFLSPGRLESPFLRFFIRCRVWRKGVVSRMYDRYNFLKTCAHWFNS